MSLLSQWITQHWTEVVTFLLVAARAGGMMIGAPFWGSRVVPVIVRVWVAILLAVATYPLVQVAQLSGGVTLLNLFLALLGETLLGLILGWLAQLLFAGARLAGQVMEMKSGLGLVQLVDPHEGGQTGVFAIFLELVTGLMFFTMNGHHLLIQALQTSFQVFPLGGDKFAERLLAGFIQSTGNIFTIALRISAPVIVGLLLSDIVLGCLSRVVPQMNVFMVAQPVQFAFAIILLMFGLPAIIWFVARQLPDLMGMNLRLA